MLVLKSIGKVLGEILGITLLLVLCIAAFVAACFAFNFIIMGIDGVIAMIVGVAGWTAVKAFLGNLGLGILISGCILGVLFLFGAEVYEEYQRQKRRAGL